MSSYQSLLRVITPIHLKCQKDLVDVVITTVNRHTVENDDSYKATVTSGTSPCRGDGLRTCMTHWVILGGIFINSCKVSPTRKASV